MKKNVEILAPGGSIEGIRAALNCGADAVYTGGQMFGARAYASNLDEDSLIQMIKEVHYRGKKLYLTVNTLLKDQEIDEKLIPYLEPYYKAGLDAVLIQDQGAWDKIHDAFPDLPLHVSTQMNMVSPEYAAYMKAKGAERIVPARELSLAELCKIKDQVDIEIETFVHGALCYCYSGQCLMSSMIGGRSGNRGRCAQPCRLPYSFKSEGKLVNKELGQYLLSPKDICTLKILPDLIDADIDSFKIEGRMKKPEYAAYVSYIYRKYADLYAQVGRDGYQVDPEDLKDLSDLYNRGGFSEGYYHIHNSQVMMSPKRPNHYGTPAAKVVKIEKNRYMLEAIEDLYPQDVLEFFELSEDKRKADWTLKSALPTGERLWVSHPYFKGLKEGMICNRTRNDHLLNSIKEMESQNHCKHKLQGYISIIEDQPVQLTVLCDDLSVQVVSEQKVQKAEKRAIEEKDVIKQLSKTGDTPFVFESLEVILDQGVFVPMTVFNQLRRQAVEDIMAAIDACYGRGIKETCSDDLKLHDLKCTSDEQQEQKFSVLVTTEEQLKMALAEPWVSLIYVDDQLALSMDLEKQPEFDHKEKQLYLALPHVMRQDEQDTHTGLIDKLKCFDGFLVRSLDGLLWIRKYSNQPVVADAPIYTWNRYAKQSIVNFGAARLTVPEELNENELKLRGCDGDEMIIYGRRPLMISTQCLLKTEGQCLKAHGKLKAPYHLVDRKRMEMPVVPRCRYCYNLIYNSQVTDLISEASKIAQLGVNWLRIEFTDETEFEVSHVFSKIKQSYYGEHYKDQASPYGITRGHFKRGVE